ncbi:helix-turn-helix domain-containing protein [Actinotalea sp.]|uniref:helix-turn-helix domain-containing protein n=1 Tax=Actinotalea sp. TaxID=1872145 RepID=UPI00356164B5
MTTTAAGSEWDDLTDVVTSNVRAEIARRRLSQRRACVGLGLSQQALSDRLTGRVRLTIDDLARFASFLGLEPSELLVRHQGLEPRTRWFGASVIDLAAWRAARSIDSSAMAVSA